MTGSLLAAVGFLVSAFAPNMNIVIVFYGCVGGKSKKRRRLILIVIDTNLDKHKQ